MGPRVLWGLGGERSGVLRSEGMASIGSSEDLAPGGPGQAGVSPEHVQQLPLRLLSPPLDSHGPYGPNYGVVVTTEFVECACSGDRHRVSKSKSVSKSVQKSVCPVMPGLT